MSYSLESANVSLKRDFADMTKLTILKCGYYSGLFRSSPVKSKSIYKETERYTTTEGKRLQDDLNREIWMHYVTNFEEGGRGCKPGNVRDTTVKAGKDKTRISPCLQSLQRLWTSWHLDLDPWKLIFDFWP